MISAAEPLHGVHGELLLHISRHRVDTVPFRA
jgi:hypothetical protein